MPFAFLLLLASRPCIAAPTPPAATITITFLATSDIHGFIEGERTELLLDGKKVGVERGGLPLFAGYVGNARKANPGHVIVLDGGDMLQGTMVSNLGEGHAVMQAMNAVGYAAAALGNHEFDFGPVGDRAVPQAPGDDPRGALGARAKEARFPILSANVTDEVGAATPRTTMSSIVRPFTVISVDGIKVGIVGGTSEDTPRTTNRMNLPGVRVEPLAPAIVRAATAARSAGATVVVALVHEGGECTRFDDPEDLSSCRADSEAWKLARALPPGTVDAIFGGHSHQGVAHRVAGIPVLQPYAHARLFSRLDLRVDRKTGRPVVGGARIHPPTEVCAMVADAVPSCDERRARGTHLVPVVYEGREVTADASVAASFADDVKAATAKRNEAIGVALATPIHARYREESALGNLAADALRHAGQAEIGITNGGGLRADLPAGELRYGALFEAFPFDNRLAILRVPGAALRSLATKNFGGDHGILSLSGLTARGTCAGDALSLELTLADGGALADEKLYSVATSDFLANGGDDFSRAASAAAPGSMHIDEAGPTIREFVAAELRRLGPRIEGDQAFYSPAKPRVSLPRPRPFPCREKPPAH